jgi:hypothetical protein
VQIALLAVSPSILRANPFMMPQNLADRAVAMAQGATATVSSSSDPITVRDAESVLLQTSVSADVRVGGGVPRRAWDDNSGVHR